MTAQSEITPPPHALMSEKEILSCMFRDPSNFIPRSASDGIDVEAFYLPSHQLIFENLKADYQMDGGLDSTLFIQKRLLDKTIDRMGGVSTVLDVFGYSCNAGQNWSHHAEILREQKALRVSRNGQHALSQATTSDEAAETARKLLADIQSAIAGPRRSSTGKQAVDGFSCKLKADHEAGEFPGKATGIDQLDKISGGLKPGELLVVGGKPSRGKSVLLLQIAGEFIRREDPVAIFSLEMMKHEIVGRLISTMGRVDYGSITQPKSLTKGDVQRIQRIAGSIAAAPVWIDDSASQSIETITAEATRIRDSHGCLALIVVDYIQLIRGGRNKNESREEEVARASGGLKQMAKALGCPVISASQLNEQGQVRESRAIEQDADAVLFIVEEGIKIGKMRNGVRNSVLNLQLDGRFQRFTERHA